MHEGSRQTYGEVNCLCFCDWKNFALFLCLFIAKPSFSETMFTARETALVKHWFECSMRLVALNAWNYLADFKFMVIEWSFWSIKQIIIIWSAITDLQIFLEKSIFGAFLFKMYSYLGEIVFGLGRQNTRRALNFLRMILFQDFSFCNKSLVR